jgi:hypothetical protein
MNALELMVRHFAHRQLRNGVSVLTTGGDPVLEAAFKQLGWTDGTAPEEAATVREPERAVLPRPRGRLSGAPIKAGRKRIAGSKKRR